MVEATESYDPAKDLHSAYIDQWDTFSDGTLTLQKLHEYAYEGQLRDSSFRALAWMILLGCVPVKRDRWVSCLNDNRMRYARLKTRYPNTPPDVHLDLDPQIHHPLTEEKKSPWLQYFEDADLRNIIRIDVQRAFPEIEFFSDPNVRAKLSSILYIFAKINPELSYRQGMHEILAPILFVLYSDQQAFEHQTEVSGYIPRKDILEVLQDKKYVEHDCFYIFFKVMKSVSAYYFTTADLPRVPLKLLFGYDAEQLPGWLEQLYRLYDGRFQRTDQPLWGHLRSLKLTPRYFGMRWFRLLFGREFPFPDLLYLWDVIFTDSPKLRLVDEIFMAMMIQIRSKLLEADYSQALHYLLRYPPITDVQAFVKYCLHLRDPLKFTKPSVYGVTHFTHITVAGERHPNQDRRVTFANPPNRQSATSSPTSHPMRTLPAQRSRSRSRTPTTSPSSSRRRPANAVVNGTSTSSNSEQAAASTQNEPTVEELKTQVFLLQEQISLLQANCDKRDLMAKQSARQLHALVKELDDSALTKDTFVRVKKDIRAIVETLCQDVFIDPNIFDKLRNVEFNRIEVGQEALSPPRTIPPAVSNQQFLRSRSPACKPRTLPAYNELQEMHYNRKQNF